MALKYKRILLKISGEALGGEKGMGFDEPTISAGLLHDTVARPPLKSWTKILAKKLPILLTVSPRSARSALKIKKKPRQRISAK